MSFCGKCGTQLENGVAFCPNCGTPVQNAAQQPNQQAYQQPNQQGNDFSTAFKNLNNTADTTAQFDPADIAANKLMGVLSYLGLLVLIPIFAAPKSKFARFHANQGLTLLIVNAAYTVLSVLLNLIKVTSVEYFLGYPYEVTKTPWIITLLLWLIVIPILALAVLGIINAAQGKAKELPVIGKISLLK